MLKLPDEKTRWYLALTFTSLAFSIVMVRNAWLNDDAYITFRVVDNFVNGYGLRWNVDERVQAYTNPLWLFVVSALYFFTREMYLTSILLSISLSLISAFALISFHTQRASQVLVCFSILAFSRCFVDYSTSGLENPLTYLILSIFLLAYFRMKDSPLRIFILSLFASLSAFNRLDTLLLYIPALSFEWMTSNGKLRNLVYIGLGFLPLICWECFSLIYYGFLFPNTAYAKLNNFVERKELLIQGFYYFKWLWERDTSSVLAIILGVSLPIVRKDLKKISLIGGILLYSFYVLWIGGDFMGGRFFSPLVLFSAFVIVSFQDLFVRYKMCLSLSIILIISSLIRPFSPITTGKDFGKDQTLLRDETGIGNDRMYYYQITGLLNWEMGKLMPKESFSSVRDGLVLRKQNKKMVKVYGCIGFRGFFAGPKVHIIDYWALADPLLSRIPPLYKPKWMIGHFWRHVPGGYLESIETGESRFKDRNLGEFYKKLKIITQGPIWSLNRWREILRVNLGFYDSLIDKDFYRFAGIKFYDYDKLKEQLNKLSSDTGIKVPKRGLEIRFPFSINFREIKAELKAKDKFYFLFFRDKDYVGRLITTPSSSSDGFEVFRLEIPERISKVGINKLRIFVYPRDVESEIRDIEILRENQDTFSKL
ncbi:MAG: hypothetical protein N3G21_06070 [Candidatus Hydrogenedentes bacterium]|nr:hypothetical protein [Candidatus Hydrogenedentota bacterium]